MSVLAGCGHKSEWICSSCAACASCCRCPGELKLVHINTREAAMALHSYAVRKREEYERQGKKLDA